MKQNKPERIPKIIHYCWFGGNPLPENAKKCIESWRKYCPDYEIIEWNEQNFNVNDYPYTKEAYELKKWAFVSDYVRLFVLFKYGGIYLDTDVELIGSLDSFLQNEAFLGFELPTNVSTAVMACVKKNKLFGKFLDYYKGRHFITHCADGADIDTTTNVVIITKICRELGLRQQNCVQEINGAIVYSNDYFSPKDPGNGKTKITNNSVAIHHFDGTWLEEDRKKRIRLREDLFRRFGNRMGMMLYRTVFLPYRVWTFLRARGMNQMLIFIKNRFKNNKRKEE